MKWKGDYSEDRRFMLQEGAERNGRRWEPYYQLLERHGPNGFYTIEHGIFFTRREAKRQAAEILRENP